MHKETTVLSQPRDHSGEYGYLFIGLAYKWPSKPTSLYLVNGLGLQMFPGAPDVEQHHHDLHFTDQKRKQSEAA